MKLGEIARSLGCELYGDSNIEITGVAGIEDAKAGELTFLANPKYRPLLATTQASAVIVTKDVDAAQVARLLSANPQLDFARAIELSTGTHICAGHSSDRGYREIRNSRSRSSRGPLLFY